jgi:hypothetical protein
VSINAAVAEKSQATPAQIRIKNPVNLVNPVKTAFRIELGN